MNKCVLAFVFFIATLFGLIGCESEYETEVLDKQPPTKQLDGGSKQNKPKRPRKLLDASIPDADDASVADASDSGQPVSWVPSDEDSVNGAQVRFYRSDMGIIANGTATRFRAGLQSVSVPVAYSARANAETSLDGQAFVELANGRWLLLGGAPGGRAYESVNTIWYSDDKGKTWHVLLPNAPASSTRPAPAHTFGSFEMTVQGVEYVYWIGSDPFTPSGDVFRSADGGLTWARISRSCPTSGLALYNYGVLDNVIYVMGGQTSIENEGVVSNIVYKSTDYGVTWTSLGAAPWPGRGAQLGSMPVMSGHLWLIAGGHYDTVTPAYYNDVWKFDGTTWTQVLADGNAQIPRSYYHSTVVHNGRLWRFNGTTFTGGVIASDTKSAHCSDDGITWIQPFAVLPWGNTHAQAAIASSDGIYITEGFQSAQTFVVREHTGALVSAWNDQGQGKLTLTQDQDEKKPIVQPSMFKGLPGIVGTGGQIMSLASPDRDIVEGVYEAWVIVKSLNYDESPMYGGPNPPAALIASRNESSYNSFGLFGGELEYINAGGGYIHARRGAKLNDDVPHLVGVQHFADGTAKLYVDGVQVGTTATDLGYSKLWTGWDSILGGYREGDQASAVLGAVIVRRASTAWDAATLAKLTTWSLDYGVSP